MNWESKDILIVILNPILLMICSYLIIKYNKKFNIKSVVVNDDVAKYDLFNTSPVVDKVRPPNYIFGIVWIILYTLIGISWVYDDSLAYDVLLIYIFLDLSLLLWLYFYTNKDLKGNTKYSLFTINFSILLTLIAFVHGSNTSKYCMVFLLTWLSFALKLNYTEALEYDDNEVEDNFFCFSYSKL